MIQEEFAEPGAEMIRQFYLLGPSVDSPGLTTVHWTSVYCSVSAAVPATLTLGPRHPNVWQANLTHRPPRLCPSRCKLPRKPKIYDLRLLPGRLGRLAVLRRWRLSVRERALHPGPDAPRGGKWQCHCLHLMAAHLGDRGWVRECSDLV